MKHVTHNQEETYEVARKVAGDLEGGEVLALAGELGSGKTEFVRGLAQALDSSDSVRSPSFTLLNHYRLEHDMIKHLIHVDLYRLQGTNSNVLEEIGLDEWLDRKDTLIVIEWPTDEILSHANNVKKITFEHGEGENERVINLAPLD